MKPITKRLLTGGVTAVLVFSALLAVQMRPRPLVPEGTEVAVTAAEKDGVAAVLGEEERAAVAAVLEEQTMRRALLPAAADAEGGTISFRLRAAGGEWQEWEAVFGEKAAASQGKRQYTLSGGPEGAAALDAALG